MGQQHRKVAKRRRRKAYLERIRAKVKKVAAPRPQPVKTRAKKQAASAAQPAESRERAS